MLVFNQPDNYPPSQEAILIAVSQFIFQAISNPANHKPTSQSAR